MEAKVMLDVQTLKFNFVPFYICKETGPYVEKHGF